MHRHRTTWGYALPLFLLVFGLVACEDLRIRALCGDGVPGEGEDCDGALPPGVTCKALGHYDGVVRCGADCRFDVTGCRRCGDGVLDLEDGERYEVGHETCWREGYVGGDHQTADCRFFHPETCLPYLTVSRDPPVSRPALALDTRGRLWLSGLARGPFPGYTERPNCPYIHKYWEYYNSKGSWSRYMGYIIDPECDQEFLAFYDPAGRREIPLRPPVEGTTGRVLALADGGVALVSRTDTQVALMAVFASGASTRTTYLANASLPERWSIARLPDGRLGIVLPGPGQLELRVLDPVSGATPVVLRLGREFEFNGTINNYYIFMPWYTPDPYGTGLLAAWESPNTVSLLIGVQRPEGQGATGLHWVRLQGQDSLARVTHLVALAPPVAELEPFKLHVDPATGTFSVAWKIGDSALHFQRLSWTGETLADWRYTFRAGRIFEALDFQADGGVIVAGTIYDYNGPIPFNDPTCSLFGRGYFAERLDPRGARVSETSFTANGIYPGTYPQFSEVCDEVTRAYLFNGGRVIVGGTHMTMNAFCDPFEVLPTYNGDPFLICDIHFVQLTL